MAALVSTPGLLWTHPPLSEVPCFPSRSPSSSALLPSQSANEVCKSRRSGSSIGAHLVSGPPRHTFAHHHCRSNNLVRSKGVRLGAGGLHFRLKCRAMNARMPHFLPPVGHAKAGSFPSTGPSTGARNKGHGAHLYYRPTSKWTSGMTRCSLVDGFEIDLTSSSSAQTSPEIPQSAKGVFPGGFRRAEVRLPGLVLRVTLEPLQTEETKNTLLEEISTAVTGGVTMIILEAGGDGGFGSAKLYDAGCMLKTMLRGRAELLVAERVDIAAASGADGVILSDEGLSAMVARRMMQNSGLETSVLPLVARSVSSAPSAQTAAAGEGADLLILNIKDNNNSKSASAFVKEVCDECSIPVFLDMSGCGAEPAKAGLDLLQNGANGLVLNTIDIREPGTGVSSLLAAISVAIERRKAAMENNTHSPDSIVQIKEEENLGVDVEDGGGAAFLGLPEDVVEALHGDTEEQSMTNQVKQIVNEERVLLTAMVDFVKDASPDMEEVSLLIDTLKQLDELFLSVVVGEFNSGKSSIINALLGKRYLKEGVLPTTNEITLLRHASNGEDTEEREERHPDGHFLRFLPAGLLKQMNLVDTPGTNVILQRQQRLTEEFVPRADLVLFVLSADRPLTESEVTFLRYIRQWGKKVVFILNKSDVLSTYTEVEEVRNFVRDNAQRLLTVDDLPVYAVSARQALQAKLSATASPDGTPDPLRLAQDPLWTTSGFRELEDFIFGFMGASTDRGAERLRLKLETPLGVGLALLSALEAQLKAEELKAESDLKALEEVGKQLARFEAAMVNGAGVQRQQTLDVIDAAKGRASKFVDSILRLSNVEAIGRYLVGSSGQSGAVSSGFDNKVIGSAITDVQKALEEHKEWIESNSIRQLSSYRSLVMSRWPQLNEGSRETNENSLLVEPRNGDYAQSGEQSDSSSLAVLEGFDTNAALILLEQEFREVVVNIFSGVGAAGISASVLTTILPNTLEDLIALGVCSAGGLVGVWNLPSRREEVKKKVRRAADSLARQVEEAMKEDLERSLKSLRAEVGILTAPYLSATEESLSRVGILQEELHKLDSELKRLRQSVQNIGS